MSELKDHAPLNVPNRLCTFDTSLEGREREKFVMTVGLASPIDFEQATPC